MRRLLVLVVMAALSGCTVPEAPSPTSTTAPTGTSGTASPITTSSSIPTTTTTAPTTAPTYGIEPLTDFEKALTGTWRRLHVKNSGYSNEYSYYEYVDFDDNRTACRWKYGEESSSDSTDDVFDSSDYPAWRITEQLSGSGERYRVVVEGRGLDYVFDFVADHVYPAGFETLIFAPNTDGKSCVHRDGPSY